LRLTIDCTRSMDLES